MKLNQFNFKLPTELVSKYPSQERDECRLMVIDRKKGKIEHKIFKELVKYFDNGDVMVFNNTKVFPARLYGSKEKTKAEIEVFLLRELNPDQKLWDVLVDPARKIRIGNKLYFGENEELVAEVIDNTTSRGRTLRFLCDTPHDKFKEMLYQLGETPLPHWVRPKVEKIDNERYQTVYAKEEGAVAAPTAGLHFSNILLKRMEIKGIQFAEITLHVGLGNFRVIEVEDLSKHKVDSEKIVISEATAKIINSAKDRDKRVCAVGTTVLRTLETSVTTTGRVIPFDGWTNKFIFPPYEINIPDRMITNFQMPLSKMYMMACAFAGYDFLREAYNVAIKEKYGFGTYGDAMLVL
ncbi:MAG: tRNA preQ1(34) S-adenosylmethionine ribosyltransferase-isomerase QueA [Prevotellaceae bacterium]|jgi:S-adenosylmethionine:tRNA ribosyltransferase-isomerase|nr:tRNA preQ1(34) S-adenosylmethionine ribosyltransferase-isomerase QueA [Prevotellaceae bacterium]